MRERAAPVVDGGHVHGPESFNRAFALGIARNVAFVVVTQPWTVESGLITPTFKVRRNRIEDVYASHYERWVVERRTVIWHEG